MSNRIIKAITAALVALSLWYAHHLGDAAGYQRGYGEKVEAANERLKEDNAMLSSSLAYMQAQIESARSMLDERDTKLATLSHQAQQTRGRTDAAVRKHQDWACSRVPDDVARSMRTAADQDGDADSDDAAACPAH